jgi:CRISPR-associated protein Cmr2
LPADWDLLTTAFLHDPPDKALDIHGHERRAARYLEAALDHPVDIAMIKQEAGLADRLAAIAERLPMPTAGRNGERAVSVRSGKLRVHHPLGGGSQEMIMPHLDEAKIEAEIRNIVAGVDSMRLRPPPPLASASGTVGSASSSLRGATGGHARSRPYDLAPRR